MRKVVAIALALSLLLSGYCISGASGDALTVEAKVSMQTTAEGITQEILVKIKTAEALSNRKCALLVVRPDADLSAAGSYIDKIAAMYQAYTDENGAYEFQFPFDDKSGEYSLQVKVDGISDVVKTTLYIPSVASLSDLMKRMENKEINADELRTIALTQSRDINLDITIFQALPESNQKEICQDVLDNLSTYTIEALIQQFEHSVILKGLSGEASVSVKQELIDFYDEAYLQIKTNSLYAEYEKLDDNSKAALFAFFRGAELDSIDKARSLFFENLFLAELQNTSVYTQLSGVAEKYKDQLQIGDTLDRVNHLGQRRANLIYSKLMKDKKQISTVAKFVSYLEDCVTNIDKLDEKNTSSTGGSGSGSSGSSSTIKIPIEDNNQDTPKPIGDATLVAFNDISDVEWARTAIDDLVKRKILQGKESTKFCPNDNITRAEFVKMLSEVFGYVDASATCNFTDVPKDYWGYPYIAGTAANGIIKGVSDSEFGAENTITREDIVTLIYRAIIQQGHLYNIPSVKNEFADFDKVSDYAQNAVLMMQKMELISGYEDQTFRPQENATRAETAVMIYQLIKVIETAK